MGFIIYVDETCTSTITENGGEGNDTIGKFLNFIWSSIILILRRLQKDRVHVVIPRATLKKKQRRIQLKANRKIKMEF